MCDLQQRGPQGGGVHCVHQGQGFTPKDGRGPDSPQGSRTPAVTRSGQDDRKTRETDQQPLTANTTKGLPPNRQCPSTSSQHHLTVPKFVFPLANLPLHKEPP